MVGIKKSPTLWGEEIGQRPLRSETFKELNPMDNLRYPTLLTCGGGVKRASSVLTNWGRKPSAIFLGRQNRMKSGAIR